MLTGAINRLINESQTENVKRLYELTEHENTFLAETAGCALCKTVGIDALSCALQTSDRCMADDIDCDSLNHEILELVWAQPEAAFNALRPLVEQRDYSHRLSAIWAISFVNRDEARLFLATIFRDSSETEEVRNQAAYYYDHR